MRLLFFRANLYPLKSSSHIHAYRPIRNTVKLLKKPENSRIEKKAKKFVFRSKENKRKRDKVGTIERDWNISKNRR